MPARSCLVVLAVLVLPQSVAAQTVRDLAARGACSTAGLEGISRQLAEAQMCIRPGAFVRFAPHEGITLTSSRVHPYAQATARDALHRAAARGPIQVNSAFRTLADQYVLYHSGGCGLAARPGQSNHQSGRAVDVGNYSGARSALEAQGCGWLGSRDPVHFDCPGSDRRPDSILAFQRLWNRNHPEDRIAEDGLYGPQTESRLGRTPAAGFAEGLCETPTDPPPATGTVRLVGVVYEGSDTDARIGGASVRLVGRAESATARDDGVWELHVPSGTYTVEASAGDFVTGRRTCEVAGGETWCSVGLMRGSEAGTARGVVFEDLGEGFSESSARLAGATVVIAETGDTSTTDDTGSWSVPLPPATYRITASKDGFAAASRTCTVEAGGEAWCSVGLAPAVAAGAVEGVVFVGEDMTRRVVGATVRVLETGASTTSREGDGSFRFELAAGVYTVEVTGDGLVEATRACEVAAGDTTACSVSVELDASGGAVTTITIDESEMDHPDDRDEDPRDAVDGLPGTPSKLTGGCSTALSTPADHPPHILALLAALALLQTRRRR